MQALKTNFLQYNLPTISYQIMKTAFLTLLGTSAVMAISPLLDNDSVNVQFSDGTAGTLTGVSDGIPKLEDANGAEVAGAVNCVFDAARSTTVLNSNTRPLAADNNHRGIHSLKCSLDASANANIVGSSSATSVYVDTDSADQTSPCAARTFPAVATAVEVTSAGTVSFAPPAIGDTCNGGRLKTEADISNYKIKVTLKGDVKSVYSNYENGVRDMEHEFDNSDLSAHDFNIGIADAVLDYLEAPDGCGSALCIGGAKYEYSVGGTVFHTQSNVGFKFNAIDHTWSIRQIAATSLTATKTSGTYDADDFLTLAVAAADDGHLLSHTVACHVEDLTFPIAQFDPTLDGADILAACEAARSADVVVTCTADGNGAASPNIGTLTYDAAPKYEFEGAPVLTGTDDVSRALTQAEMLSGTAQVTISASTNPAIVSQTLNGAAPVNGGWVIDIAHGLDTGTAGEQYTGTVDVVATYYAGCADAATSSSTTSINIALTNTVVYSAPTLTAGTAQRFQKWAVSQISGNPELDTADLSLTWCTNGADDLNTCDESTRKSALYTHIYINGATGCEGMSEGAVVKLIQFTQNGEDLVGVSQLKCPAPRSSVSLGSLVLDYDIEFSVSGTDVTLSIDGQHTLSDHTAVSTQYLDESDTCLASGSASRSVADASCDQAAVTYSYTDFRARLADTSGCGSYLVEQVTFTDQRDQTEIKFCQSKHLSLGIALQTGSATATFSSAQVGGTDAVFSMSGLEFESCGAGLGYQQKMSFTYDQRGGSAVPTVTTTSSGIFPTHTHSGDGDVGTLAYASSCYDICADGLGVFADAETTSFQLDWAGGAGNIDSSMQYSVSTQILDSPCAESQEIADGMLGTTMEINVGAGADVNACVSGMDASNVTVGQTACFEFRQPDGDAAASNTLEVTGVSLTDQFGAAYAVAGALAVGGGGYTQIGSLGITQDMALRDFTLVVDYQETVSRRRLRSEYTLGAKGSHADGSFTVLPSSISVQDKVELDQEEKDNISIATVSLIGLACVLLLRLVWVGFCSTRGVAKGTMAFFGLSRAKLSEPKYERVGRFTSAIKY